MDEIGFKKPIIIFLILILILFAIVYFYKSKISEDFGSYQIVDANDTVLINKLNNIKVGTQQSNFNFINKITSDDTFMEAINNIIKNNTNNIITFEDLFQNLSSYINITDFNNLLNNKIGGYLKKNNILTSNELNKLINESIIINNTTIRTYTDTILQNTIPNIINNINNTPKLIGITNYKYNITTSFYGYDNADPVDISNYVILGKFLNTKLIRINVNTFINNLFSTYNIYLTDAEQIKLTGPFSANKVKLGKLFICIFDWTNDKNIFYNNKTPNAVNYRYIFKYPEIPFSLSNIKQNHQYLFDLSTSVVVPESQNTNIALYCILFNGTEDNPTYDIKLVKIFTEYQGYTKILSDTFVIQTTENTFNIGLYLSGLNGTYIELNNMASATSISVSELPKDEQLSTTTT